jgi:hypothetical protein
MILRLAREEGAAFGPPFLLQLCVRVCVEYRGPQSAPPIDAGIAPCLHANQVRGSFSLKLRRSALPSAHDPRRLADAWGLCLGNRRLREHRRPRARLGRDGRNPQIAVFKGRSLGPRVGETRRGAFGGWFYLQTAITILRYRQRPLAGARRASRALRRLSPAWGSGRSQHSCYLT